MISSKNNRRIKELRALHHRQGNNPEGLFLVEGIRPVGEALEAGADLITLCYAPELLRSSYALNLVASHAGGIECLEVTPEVFESLADKDNPAGLMAVARLKPAVLADLDPVTCSWAVALVAPQDPGNIGTILRTMDAVGAHSLLLLDGGADPTHPATVRASMGAIFWHPVVRDSFENFTQWAKSRAYHVVGTSAHAGQEIGQVTAYPRPLVLMLGSERQGLTSEQAAICDQMIGLPMHGRSTSLNLAVAAGIFLYDILLKG